MSKGSNQRPSQVPKDKYEENWERIFGKKKVKEKPSFKGRRVYRKP